jgi:hypothetical protein
VLTILSCHGFEGSFIVAVNISSIHLIGLEKIEEQITSALVVECVPPLGKCTYLPFCPTREQSHLDDTRLDW